jgi:hypothetical protein
MGLMYPAHVKASHINMIPSMPPKFTSSPFGFIKFLAQYAIKWYTPEEKAGLDRTQWFRKDGNGYYELQTTKPQTLGFSLNDSPVGLLAWIYEKLHDWTDSYPWTDEEVCTWVSIYWFSTAGPGASINIYRESQHGEYPAFETATKFLPIKLVSRHMLLAMQCGVLTNELGPVLFPQGARAAAEIVGADPR